MPIVPLGEAGGRTRWTVEQDGRSYLVLEEDGRYVVTDALCPHRQLSLAEGLVRDGALVCPGHWYAFDLASGECRTTGDLALPIYPVVTDDGALGAVVPEPVAPLSWSERLRAHAQSDP